VISDILRANLEEKQREERMPNPAPLIVRLLAAFAPAFTAPTFAHALTLAYGAILAPGRRTVTAALRATGRDDERQFTTYHRVLNRAAWSPLALSRILGLPRVGDCWRMLWRFPGAQAAIGAVRRRAKGERRRLG
jgi:hypothetical protein